MNEGRLATVPALVDANRSGAVITTDTCSRRQVGLALEGVCPSCESAVSGWHALHGEFQWGRCGTCGWAAAFRAVVLQDGRMDIYRIVNG